MVESGTLDPLIKQGVLAKALDSPDVVIELIQQGVMDDLVETGARAVTPLPQRRQCFRLKRIHSFGGPCGCSGMGSRRLDGRDLRALIAEPQVHRLFLLAPFSASTTVGRE